MIEMCLMTAAVMVAAILVAWYIGRRHKKKETEIRAMKSNLKAEVQKTCAAAKQGDSDASLRLEAFKDSITEQSLRMTGKPKPPTTVIKPEGIQ